MARNLQFRTNSRHIGQLGRELVTDFVTALVELVKNSYDADAGSVLIRIENANTPDSRIIVADTGCGMTQEEFESHWMVIGTNNKLSAPYSPGGRKRAGKKGIGRFSVERLAERVTIYSYTAEEDYRVSINWNRYEEISVTGLKQRIQILRGKRDAAAAKYISNQVEYYLSLKLDGEGSKDQMYVREMTMHLIDDYETAYEPSFLEMLEKVVLPIMAKQEKLELRLEDIDNPLEEITNREKEETYRLLCQIHGQESGGARKPVTGIVMVLDRLRDNWRQKDIDKLQKELRLLVAPEFIEKNPFRIHLTADQFKIPEEMSVDSILNLNFAHITARIYGNGTKSEIIYIDKDGRRETYHAHYDTALVCGDFTFELYYFLRDSAHMTNETYNYRFALRVLDVYCGIKIYRDSFRVKPYGDLGNDWLELDKSKVSDTHGYRVGNNQTIGVIRISDESNPLLIDATNREGIIENEAYEQMRDFILECINVISNIRKEAYEKTRSKLDRAKDEQKKQKGKAQEYRKAQDIRYRNTLDLLEKSASYEDIKASFIQLRDAEKSYHKTAEEQYEKTEDAYQSYVEFQETELSMYKNLASLGILTGSFGHETQDIIARIENSLSFYRELGSSVDNPYFKAITETITSDFARISGYSMMIVEFLRKKKRSPEENLDFGGALNGVCRLYRGMLRAFHIDFSWHSAEDIHMTMRQIDLESIIINMITNAFEQVKSLPKKEIRIIFEQQEEDIFLYFEDSGRGVPPEEREKIFQPFKTSKEDGIGLGLNIVKDITESYGGTVRVSDSEHLGGAKFIVHFVKKEAS